MAFQPPQSRVSATKLVSISKVYALRSRASWLCQHKVSVLRVYGAHTDTSSITVMGLNCSGIRWLLDPTVMVSNGYGSRTQKVTSSKGYGGPHSVSWVHQTRLVWLSSCSFVSRVEFSQLRQLLCQIRTISLLISASLDSSKTPASVDSLYSFAVCPIGIATPLLANPPAVRCARRRAEAETL